VQALEDSIATFEIDFLHEAPSTQLGRNGGTGLRQCGELDTPQPSQDIRGQHSDAASCRDASERLLCAWLTMGKLIASDDNGNKAGDFRYRAGEEGLQGGEPRIKGRSALGVGCEWN
jgi:hypothetical protein